MAKKFIRLVFEKKTIAVCPVEEVESATDFLKLQKEAFQNSVQLLKRIKEGEERIAKLEKEVRILKGED